MLDLEVGKKRRSHGVWGTMESTAERVAIAVRGVRFPARLSDLLAWAEYNHADRKIRRNLEALPWRSYRTVSDVAEEIDRSN